MQITLGANSKRLQARELRERGEEESNRNTRLHKDTDNLFVEVQSKEPTPY
jgi:hypothetical protein